MNISLINGFQEGILEKGLYLFGQVVPMSLVENTRSPLVFSLNLGTARIWGCRLPHRGSIKDISTYKKALQSINEFCFFLYPQLTFICVLSLLDMMRLFVGFWFNWSRCCCSMSLSLCVFCYSSLLFLSLLLLRKWLNLEKCNRNKGNYKYYKICAKRRAINCFAAIQLFSLDYYFTEDKDRGGSNQLAQHLGELYSAQI